MIFLRFLYKFSAGAPSGISSKGLIRTAVRDFKGISSEVPLVISSRIFCELSSKVSRSFYILDFLARLFSGVPLGISVGARADIFHGVLPTISISSLSWLFSELISGLFGVILLFCFKDFATITPSVLLGMIIGINDNLS